MSSYQHHVFLSYSRKDTDLMQKIRDGLRAEGLTVWTDEGITPGTPLWDQAIEQGLDNAGCMVVILTPNSKNANGVRKEIHYAQGRKLHIIPLMADGDESNAVPWTLAGWQWIDTRNNFATGIKTLVESVCNYLKVESKSQQTAKEKVRKEAEVQRRLTQEQEHKRRADEQAEQLRFEQARLRQRQQERNQVEYTETNYHLLNQKAETADSDAIKRRKQINLERPRSIKTPEIAEKGIEATRSPSIRKLTSWNLSDQFRLLWWLFVDPENYLIYEKQGVLTLLKNTEAWLRSTLAWITLFIPSVGIILGLAPPIAPPLGISWLVWLLALIGGWLVVGLVGNQGSNGLSEVGFSISFVTAIFTATIFSANPVLGIIFGVVSIIVDSFVLGMMLHDADQTFTDDLLGATLGSAGCVMGFPVAGLLMGGVVSFFLNLATNLGGAELTMLAGFAMGNLVAYFFGYLVAAFLISAIGVPVTAIVQFAIMQNLNKGKFSFLAKFSVVVLFISYATLIWIHWLGGWRVLSGA